MPKRYSIRNWADHFETYETRKLKSLDWWPKPNKHDGLGFRRLVAQKNRVELYCAWNLICDVASKGSRETRGRLERDGQPLTAEDMACMTGFPETIFNQAFSFFSSPTMGWLTEEGTANTDQSPVITEGSPVITGCSAVEGKEGTEDINGGQKSKTEQSGDSSIKVRLGKLYRRRDTTAWSQKEEKAFNALTITEADLSLIEDYYRDDNHRNGHDYRRRDLLTLLNNFPGELDRARKFRPTKTTLF